jgi:hypothetical protein
MLFLTLKTIFVSLLLITLIHYLYGFFKNMLTVPKVKDLVNKPAQRYNQMFAGMNNENDYTKQERNMNVDQQIKNVGGHDKNMGQQNMQAELKNFLNELKKPITPNALPNANTIPSTNNNNFPAANDSEFGSYTPF